jgi:hypothetical protein
MPAPRTLGILLLAHASSTLAAEPRLKVSIEQQVGTDAACIDTATVRQRVSKRLERDPFERMGANATPLDLEILISSRTETLEAMLVVHSTHPELRRIIESARNDCSGLLDAIVLSVSMIIDDETEPSVTPTVKSGSTELAKPKTPSPSPSSPNEAPKQWHALSGLSIALGEAPALLPSVSAGIMFRHEWLALFGEFSLSNTFASSESTASIPFRILRFSLAPCVHVKWAFACPSVALHKWYVLESSLEDAPHPAFFNLGIEAGGWIALSARWSIVPAVRLDAPLVQHEFYRYQGDTWTVPAVRTSASLRVSFGFD